ncbi:histidine--tRNA ligase [Candidatus Bathyarchaeota archaeon]|nr:MAG: histidine--tRNA ligase [Candidatus Bathyarchaeota archaeon]
MSSPFTRTVRGMRDLLPDEAEAMRRLEYIARETARLYGYREVITPLVEHYELLAAKIGEENRRRMYVFKDLGGRRVALRPEFTASIARLVVTKMMYKPKPIRLFCTGSLYRYDEPQFGRYREFWQANYELIGSGRPEADLEILSISRDFMEKTGLEGYYFKVGHVGILRGLLAHEGIGEDEQNAIMQLLDKKEWNKALEIARRSGASGRCIKTLKELFEIREEKPNKATERIMESVDGYEEAIRAAGNLEAILKLAEDSSLELKLSVEAGFARGLEYYTGLIFEIYVPGMDIALGGGGRYDRLIELFGGEPTPATGVALGIDRIALAMSKQGLEFKAEEEGRVLVIPLTEEAVGVAFEVSSILRGAGVLTEVEVMGRRVTRALQDADRRGITHTILIGSRELKEGKITLRDMRTREQKTINLEEAVKYIRENID